MIFNDTNQYGIVEKLNNLSQEEIRSMPQFFRADYKMVFNLCPPLRLFLQIISHTLEGSQYRYCSIDSRVHMLMPRWYPCIPGWHCDDFYRPNGQPDLVNVMKNSPAIHYAVVFGKTAMTEFLDGPHILPSPEELNGFKERPTYALYNDIIEHKKVKRFRITPGQIIRFSPLVFHRGMPADNASWRVFVRLTFSNHYEPKNEIRTQTQVYLTSPFEGW